MAEFSPPQKWMTYAGISSSSITTTNGVLYYGRDGEVYYGRGGEVMYTDSSSSRFMTPQKKTQVELMLADVERVCALGRAA